MHFLHIAEAPCRIGVGTLTGYVTQRDIIEISRVKSRIKHLTVIIDIVGSRLMRQRRPLLVAHVNQLEIADILREDDVLGL